MNFDEKFNAIAGDIVDDLLMMENYFPSPSNSLTSGAKEQAQQKPVLQVLEEDACIDVVVLNEETDEKKQEQSYLHQQRSPTILFNASTNRFERVDQPATQTKLQEEQQG